VKYRDSEGLKVLKEVLKLEGSNLKVKLKCFKGIPEGGVPEGRVFDRLPKVKGLLIPDRGLL
jgi:hypothetical protein